MVVSAAGRPTVPPGPPGGNAGAAAGTGTGTGGGGSAGDTLSGEQLLVTVKKCRRVFTGRVASTPTTALPATEDMGLLMFLGTKQAHLRAATEGVDLFRYPSLKQLLSIVEFVNFVVSCLIVEAEKIDEMTISIRKEIVKREAHRVAMQEEADLQSRALGTAVHQVLAAHFPHRSPATAPRRSAAPASSEDPAAALEEDKWLLSQFRQHLRAAQRIRLLLHGRRPPPSAAEEWDEVNHTVSELGVVHAFRKAQQRIRDILIDVEDKDALPAVHSLTVFIDYLAYGMTAALDELDKSAVELKRTATNFGAERRIEHLDAQDRRNKDASCSALQYNIAVNSPRKVPVATGDGWRQYESRPPRVSSTVPPPPQQQQQHYLQQHQQQQHYHASSLGSPPASTHTTNPAWAPSFPGGLGPGQAYPSAAPPDDGFLDALCE